MILLGVLALGSARAAAPIEGVWRVENGDAKIEILPCGNELCGRIAWLREPMDEHGIVRRDVNNPDPALRARPVLGLELLSGVIREPDRKGVHRGGRIYDPKSGKTYTCQLSLARPDQLKLRGYVLGMPLLGQSTLWTRIAPGPASSR